MLEVTPISGALGAELAGVDLRDTLDDATAAEIRQALLDHLVIFFSAQELTPTLLLSFARRLGEPLAYPQLQGLPEEPLVTAVTKLEHERIAFGGVWHTDTSYLERPPLGSLLYAVELPPYGGDTLFANQYLAYEQLSEGLRRTLDGMTAVYTSTKPAVAATREDRLRERGVQAKVLTSEHPRCAPIPKPGARRSTSTAGTPRTSRAGAKRRASRCWSTCFSTRCGRSSPAATAGNRARWRSGTTAAPSTCRSTTTTATGASCTGSRWPAISRTDV